MSGRKLAVFTLLAGCAPGLGDRECRTVGDCPPERPICLSSGRCVATALEADAHDLRDARRPLPGDGALAADTALVDARETADVALADARVAADLSTTDGSPPPAMDAPGASRDAATVTDDGSRPTPDDASLALDGPVPAMDASTDGPDLARLTPDAAVPGSDATIDAPDCLALVCAPAACDPGFVDVDGLPENGCERGCAVAPARTVLGEAPPDYDGYPAVAVSDEHWAAVVFEYEIASLTSVPVLVRDDPGNRVRLANDGGVSSFGEPSLVRVPGGFVVALRYLLPVPGLFIGHYADDGSSVGLHTGGFPTSDPTLAVFTAHEQSKIILAWHAAEIPALPDLLVARIGPADSIGELGNPVFITDGTDAVTLAPAIVPRPDGVLVVTPRIDGGNPKLALFDLDALGTVTSVINHPVVVVPNRVAAAIRGHHALAVFSQPGNASSMLAMADVSAAPGAFFFPFHPLAVDAGTFARGGSVAATPQGFLASSTWIPQAGPPDSRFHVLSDDGAYAEVSPPLNVLAPLGGGSTRHVSLAASGGRVGAVYLEADANGRSERFVFAMPDCR